MTCCGGNEQIGDIRKHSLKEAFERNPYRKNPTTYHLCPYRKDIGIINEKFVSEINRKFL